jgi:phthiocerol/phenolphthiocerol synthesis type-I polyketide synthase E
VTPTAVLGHSLGEYTAATVAGALTADEAMRLVLRRGSAMAGLAAGAMLVVASTAAEVERRLPAETWVAGVNGPDSVTVAGAPEPVAKLREVLRAEGIAATRIDVEHAFHTPLVEPALPGLRAAAELAGHQPLALPLIGNRTGEPIAAGRTLDAEHWVRHAREPVRLDAAVGAALALPEPVFLELGAGTGLTDAVRRNAGGTRTAAFALGRRDPVLRERDVLAALAGYWTAGGSLDFAALPAEAPRRIPLPTYPYQRSRHWVDPIAPAGETPGPATVSATVSAPVAEPGAAPEPVDETVEGVRRIWTELLGHETFEPEVNFLELGGTSLTAIQMLTRLRREFGVRLSLHVLFDNPTIDGIAGLVRAKAAARVTR